MRRLKKKIYLGACGVALSTLALIRACHPAVMGEEVPVRQVETAEPTQQAAPQVPLSETPVEATKKGFGIFGTSHSASAPQKEKPHPIRGVHSYEQSFPDVQDVQIVAAQHWGVRPVRNRLQAEERKSELVFVGSCPYYVMDRGMNRSIPYLVPRAATLLQDISRNYLDSLYVKGVPLHRLLVTSVLRTEEDVARLLSSNPNATGQSCHRFGTTFDIAYNRYSTVCPPGERRREVQSDTLKYILCEVLRDLRLQGRCYVKYEVKQGCFHITTR